MPWPSQPAAADKSMTRQHSAAARTSGTTARQSVNRCGGQDVFLLPGNATSAVSSVVFACTRVSSSNSSGHVHYRLRHELVSLHAHLQGQVGRFSCQMRWRREQQQLTQVAVVGLGQIGVAQQMKPKVGRAHAVQHALGVRDKGARDFAAANVSRRMTAPELSSSPVATEHVGGEERNRRVEQNGRASVVERPHLHFTLDEPVHVLAHCAGLLEHARFAQLRHKSWH